MVQIVREALNKVAEKYRMDSTKRYYFETYLREYLKHASFVQPADELPMLVNGGLSLNQHLNLATLHGRDVQLTPKQFRMLAYFMTHMDRVITVKELLRDCWGLGHAEAPETYGHYVRALILEIRRKLGNGIIKTHTKIGYSMLSMEAADIGDGRAIVHVESSLPAGTVINTEIPPDGVIRVEEIIRKAEKEANSAE